MDLIKAAVYGFVQGVTEWLPISSTAHLRLLPEAFGWDDPGAPFTAAIQLGTTLALLVYFWREIVQILKGWIGGVFDRQARKDEWRLGWAIAIGTLPIVVFGFLLKEAIKGPMRSLWIVGGSLILMGLILAFAERFGKKTRGERDFGLGDGLAIGFWQALALVPGMSRSGSTIAGGLIMGFDRVTAAKFSFLLSTPSIVAAGLLEILEHKESLLGSQLPAVLCANAVSFITGYASISFLMHFVKSRSTMPFVVYRVGLGIAVILLLVSGKVEPLKKPSISEPMLTRKNVSP